MKVKRSSCSNFYIHRSSIIPKANAQNSPLVEEQDITLCLPKFHEIHVNVMATSATSIIYA